MKLTVMGVTILTIMANIFAYADSDLGFRSNTKISNAIGIVSTVETSFTNHTGNNKLMVDATNGLRSERNEICKRIWGLRQSIGQANDRITSLEGVKSFIDKQNVLDVIDND